METSKPSFLLFSFLFIIVGHPALAFLTVAARSAGRFSQVSANHGALYVATSDIGPGAATSFDLEETLKPIREPIRKAVRTVYGALAGMNYRDDHDAKVEFSEHIGSLTKAANTAYSSSLAHTCAGIPNRKQLKRIQDVLNAEFKPLHPLMKESPLASRILTWPRGYPGDFETIERIVQSKNHVPRKGLGWSLEEFLLENPLSQQHRNKVVRQAQIMTKYLKQVTKGSKTEILSLACGACPDLRNIQETVETADCRFTLLDMDDGAHDFSKSKLSAAVKEKCEFVQGNVMHLGHAIDTPPSSGYDLVVAGGLFDYLSDKMIVRLLNHVWNKLLAPGGSIFFTNIDSHYNDVLNIELLLNWSLIGRTDAELRNLCQIANIPENCITTEHEDTGLTVLVTCRKPYDMI